ncbi:MAG: zinc-binding dehydrogenase [Oscillospiraceae bacterium]|nr:zinc-binding dehydrogenase [Oscillospiraceae bacterium]
MQIPKTFRMGVLNKAHTLDIVTLPLPVVGEDEVLVKHECCNICTTDYTQWLGKREHQGYPMAGGHEGSGIIVAKGAKVGKELQIGDRVGLTYSYCGSCKPCRLGQQIECIARDQLLGYNVKSEFGYYGTHGFSDYMVRPAKYLIKMSPDLPPTEAGFLEPVATVVNGIHKLRVAPMEFVVVIGGGTMGLINAQVARAFGARVVVSDPMENKRKVAQEMGFETIDPDTEDPVARVKEMSDGKGADAVIVVVGSTVANDQAMEMVKHLDGRVLLFAAGFPVPALNTDSNVVHYRKLELIGAFEASQKDFYDAAALLNNRQIDVSPLISGTFSLDEIEAAFADAAVPGRFRVALTF